MCSKFRENGELKERGLKITNQNSKESITNVMT